MPWVYLIIASLLEIGWIFSLKLSDGFTKIIPIIGYAVFGLGNVFFFSLALKNLPMGTAFAVWMGIAIVGTILVESHLYNQPYSIFRLVCITLIVIGIIGLKMTSNPS